MKSFGRVRRFVVVLGATLVLSCLLAAPAFADNPANDECLTCHQSMTDWSVVDVDFNTACRKCHTDGLLGTHPYHNSGANCGAFCHTGWGGSNLTARPAFSAPEGTFAAADSVNTTSSVLHVIHAKSSWLGTVNTSVGDCRTCHAPATCSACHTAPLASRHATHAATATPFVGDLSDGLVVDSAPNHCASPNCHDLASTGAFTPADHESDSKSADPVVTRVNWGTKSYVPRPSATAGLFALSNIGGATIEAAVTGDKIQVIANKDPYRGKARIWVDGVATATVDTYSPTTLDQQVIYEAQFASTGAHTVKVEVLYERNASSRGYWIAIDSFRVYSGMKKTVAPTCVSCHPTMVTAHGTTFPHEASLTVGTYASFTCQQCHSTALFTEHGRASSVTYGGSSCSDCHTTYAPYAIDTYNYTCSWTGYGPGCHQTTQAAHLATATAHTASDAATQDCRDCHGSRLEVIHNDADATRLQHASLTGGGSNGLAYSTNCLTCHSTTKYPTTKDCTDAGCHVASGVVSMGTHPAPLHTAAPAANEAPVGTLGGKTCSVCHAMELINEHGKASSLTSTSAAIGCMSCHGATYLPTNWLADVNTCVACHPLAGGKAGDPHETTDYNVKHDYTVYGTNASSCGVGGGVYCHSGVSALLGNIATIDQMHYNKPGAGDCTSCHAATAVPTKYTCASSDCHDGIARASSHDLVGPHAATSATYPGNANCVVCHTGYTDLRNHAGACAGCHGNSVLTAANTRYLTGTFTGLCTGCHTNTVLGTVYDPTDPNHYNETTHTATIAADVLNTGGATITTKACTACHATAMKAEHSFTLSAGAVNCTTCHTNTTLGSATVIANNWPTNKCADCHGAQHGAPALAHDMAASATSLGCAGGGCHDGSNIATLHADRVLSTNGTITSCNICHASADTDLSTKTGCDSTGCHAGATAHSHPLNTVASAGCYDSGLGCHNVAATDYADAYHPGNGCTSGACHASANHFDAAFNGTISCQACHTDNLYAGAPDRVATTSVYPAGHYNETTHTATGQGTLVYGTTSGAAKAACSDCHNGISATQPDGWYAQHQGVRTGDLSCQGCHNKNATISALVTDAVRTNTCTACHAAGVLAATEVQHGVTNAPAFAATSPQSCGATGLNCHNSYDLHELHKDAAGCNLTGCHDFSKQGVKPSLTSCGSGGGSCHGTYNESTHYATHSATHVSGLQGTATYSLNGQSNTCQSCHGMALNAEHTLGTSAMSGTGSVCLRCHNNSGSTTAITGLWSGELCSACHGVATIPVAHGNTAAHTVTNTGCGASGAGCHPTSDLSKAGTDKTVNIHNDCLTCHDPAGAAGWTFGVAGNLKFNPSVKSCGQATGCHTNVFYSTTKHQIGQASEVNGNDANHTASSTAMAVKVDAYSNKNACSDCHSATLLTSHGSSSAGVIGCTSGGTGNTGCHNQTTPVNAVAQVKGNWTNDTCADCHPTKHATYTAGTHTATLGTAGTADGCANAGCHSTGATTDIRLVHDRVTSGCTVTGTDSQLWSGGCHQLNKDMPTGTMSCGSGGTGAIACHTSHTNSNHVPSHNVKTAASFGCTTSGCHEMPDRSTATSSAIEIHSVANIGASVSGKTNNGCNICHGGDGWTDVHATAKLNAPAAPLECAVCHNGTLVGAHLYDPEDPNHYYAASHDTTRASVDTSSGSTTDFHSTSVAWGYTCTTCHSADLKTEHFKSSSTFAQVPGTYSDKCIACHELKVDNFGGAAWTPANCSGLSNGCHSGTHAQMPTKHDSSAETLTAPGSTAGIVSSPATELAEGFESGNFTLNGWTVSTATYCTVQTTAPHSGTYTARLNWRASSTTAYYIQKTFDLSGYTSPVISFWSKTAALVGTDVYRVGYSTNGGSTWTYAFTKTGTAEAAWTEHVDLALPANAAVLVRFEVKPNTSNATTARYWYVDDIAITGMAGTWSTTPLAVGSTVAQSCGASYPNGGTNCHDVTDVADIHSRATTTVASVTYDGCRVCHRTNTAVPASLNCQSSGCHAGVNSDSHRDLYHESTIASGAAGQIFAGTGFISNWCTGCHDDSIDDEHGILSSYSTNACAVCHKKASDSTVPTVTAVDTSATIHGDSVANNELCTGCHKTVTATAIHSQRLGDTATAPAPQFSTSWSGHRMYDTMPGMMDPAGGYAWTRPTATTFLLAGWQSYTQAVRCSDCHGSMSGATGPHGASMSVKMVSGYNTSYQAGTMTISNFATSGGICTKCHTGLSTVNTAHNTGNHTSYACITCHVKTAHAWKRPRLIGYSTDPLPYRTTANGGLQKISLKAHTTTWAQSGDCQASCYGSHGAVSPAWP